MKSLFLGNVAADTANGVKTDLPPGLDVQIFPDPQQLLQSPDAAANAVTGTGNASVQNAVEVCLPGQPVNGMWETHLIHHNKRDGLIVSRRSLRGRRTWQYENCQNNRSDEGGFHRSDLWAPKQIAPFPAA